MTTNTYTVKLCAFGCGEPCRNGKRLCDKHLEHQRRKMAEYRAQRKSKGLCSRCENKARVMANGKVSTLCDPCRAHVRELEKVARANKLKINLDELTQPTVVSTDNDSSTVSV